MSDKKQFEYIENKIKQAVENGSPDYGQPAWDKMEELLDKKEKKRRPFLWWFILPLLLAGSWGVYKLSQLPKEEPVTVSSPSTKVQPNAQTGELTSIQPDSKKDNGSVATGSVDINAGQVEMVKTNTGKYNLPAVRNRSAISKANAKMQVTVEVNQEDNVTTTEDNIIRDRDRIMNDQSKPVNTDGQKTIVSSTENLQKDSLVKPVVQQNETVRSDTKPDKKSPQKNKVKTTKGFYFLGAVGVDIASVEPFSYSNSSPSIKYGAGLGYQLSSKWSVQTGLYASNKEYTAGPEDYHPKKGSFWDTTQSLKLKKVDANCLVYEIPVTVRYNIAEKTSVLYYVGVSASSYIMKTEDYDYHCSGYGGSYYELPYEYTGNKHFFSTLTLSGGIEKKLSPSFSLLAEPSFSMPLSGVGYGNVKLFSTALMIGVKYKPSKKN